MEEGTWSMGSGMAGNIHQAGYPLVVYNAWPEAMRPSLEREARPARSPVEVAQLSEVIFTSLSGPKEVEEVTIGAQGCWKASRRAHLRRACDQATDRDSAD
jgi:3-hydroxyisobutyrate dehydrogenase